MPPSVFSRRNRAAGYRLEFVGGKLLEGTRRATRIRQKVASPRRNVISVVRQAEVHCTTKLDADSDQENLVVRRSADRRLRNLASPTDLRLRGMRHSVGIQHDLTRVAIRFQTGDDVSQRHVDRTADMKPLKLDRLPHID